MITITAEEWYDALRDAMRPREGENTAMSSREIQEATGLAPERVRLALNRLKAEGLLVPSFRSVECLSGQRRCIPVYTLKAKHE